jgi:predicted anti-sigma-YlaC factor YlaD
MNQPHRYWLNAGARNIRSTTEEAERCQFMQPIRRRFLTRNADYILSAVVLALMMLYAIT